MGIRFWNCLWFLIPILIWNIIFSPRLTQKGFREDDLVPKWLQITENILRFTAFLYPILLPVNLTSPFNITGLALTIGGTVVYIATWLPLMNAPRSKWSRSKAGVLAPHLTPLLFFTGIAMIGESAIYASVCVFFTVFHALHGMYSFRMFARKKRT